MPRKTKPETRREFLKTAAKGVVATAITAGCLPAITPARNAHAGVETINFVYILSDHHAPLMVLSKNWELFQEKFKMYIKPVTEGQFYDFYHDGVKLAHIKLIPTKQGPDVDKLMAQGTADIAITGTQGILMSTDRGIDVQAIAPIQTAGNVFCLKKDLPINNWADFISHVKGQKRQFKIGMPGPDTVAAIIFRSALNEEGVSFTEDTADKNADILFINMKGHGNLVAALTNDLAQGIIGAQPFPAVTIDRGVGKQVLNLQDAPPPNRWLGHACCTLEATGEFLKKRGQLAEKLLELIAVGVMVTNNDKQMAGRSAASWLGVAESVERFAMTSLNYSTEPTNEWKNSIYTYVEVMDAMGLFTGRLKGRRQTDVDPIAFNFSHLRTAKENLKKRGIEA
jgi:NitT/TauT family transport system substrate-binding protein